MAERNFFDFRLTDNVYKLAPHPVTGRGVIPEIGEVFGVDMGDEPNAESLEALRQVTGDRKVLTENLPDVHAKLKVAGDPTQITYDWVKRANTQESIHRSLWTPETEVPKAFDDVIVTDAVDPWQGRTVAHLGRLVQDGLLEPGRLRLLSGNRLMNGAPDFRGTAHRQWTESRSPSDEALEATMETYGLEDEQIRRIVYDALKYPVAWRLNRDIIAPQLSELGFDVDPSGFGTDSGDQVAEEFTRTHPEAFEPGRNILFARVANAGVQQAVSYRQAARRLYPEFDFDGDPDNPQVFITTDGLPPASNPDELTRPDEFQNPATGIRQVVVTAQAIQKAQ